MVEVMNGGKGRQQLLNRHADRCSVLSMVPSSSIHATMCAAERQWSVGLTGTSHLPGGGDGGRRGAAANQGGASLVGGRVGWLGMAASTLCVELHE